MRAFGSFELDTAQKQLFRNGLPVPLPPKAADLLCLLAEADGRIVTKDEILERVWARRVVEEASIAKHVFLLRQALDEGGGPSAIETVPKRGYRLRPPAFSHAAAPTIAAPAAAARDAAGPVVAVLPFAADGALTHVAEGLVDEVLAALGAGARVRTVSRTSSFALRGVPLDAVEIGRRLRATHIVEGSLHADTGEIRVHARLVDALDGLQCWARSFRVVELVPARLGAEIAGGVAASLGAGIAADSAPPAAEPIERARAADLYRRGRYLWNRRPGAVVFDAIRHFEQAAAIDPRFALAWAGLADAYATLGSWEAGVLPHADAQRTARDHAARALSIEPQLPEAVTTLAYTALHYDWDPAAAERGFRVALAHNPSYGPACHWLSHAQLAAGRVGDSLATSRAVLALDPLNPLMHAHLAWHHLLAAEPAAAIETSEALCALEPGYHWGHFFLAWGLDAVGERAHAVDAARRSLECSNGDAVMRAGLARVLASAGDRAAALDALAAVEREEAAGRGTFAYEAGLVHLALGDTDAAATAFDRAVRDRSGWIAYAKIDPRLAPVRGDARFAGTFAQRRAAT